MIVPCRIEIYKKICINSIFTAYETMPYVLHRLVQSVRIDRRLSSNVATANIDIFYAGFNPELILYQYGGWGDDIPIIDNFNRVKIYIDRKIQFYGVIYNYSIDDENAVVHVTCQDMFYHLNRLVDCRIPYLEYKDIYVFDMMKDLATKAGMTTIQTLCERGENYVVSDLKIKYDTQVSDVFSDATATSNTRIRCLKNGDLAIEDMYHTYEVSDVPNNINYEWDYSYIKKINSSDARRGADMLYNRLLVRFDGKNYNVYDAPVLFNYMCAENRFKEVETALGDTQEKRYRMANRTFRNDTRDMTTLTTDAVKGNPDLDLGHALRINLNNRVGHYMVTGISTAYSAEGYFDTIDIEGLLPTDFAYAVLGTGNYDDDTDSDATERDSIVKANTEGKGIRISRDKSNKMGKFNALGTESSITISVTFDNSNAGLSILDPSGVIMGLEGNPNTNGSSLTKAHGTTTVTGLTTCSSMVFSTYPGLTQSVTIFKPIKGTWLIRGVGVPTEVVGATIICSIDWVMLDEDADVATYS